MLSVLILTKDEEVNIAKAIRSVSFSDDVVVLDSASTDRTAEVATGLGARVFFRILEDWSVQHNWAVKNIEFKHPWVLALDADEVCDEQLIEEIKSVVVANPPVSAFRVRRKDYFMGRWLRRSQLYPTWIVRLFRPDKVSWTRSVNPIANVDGETLSFQGHILHEPFSHGVAHWFERHNRYSDLEAIELLRALNQKIDWLGLFGSPTRRRIVIKKIAYRVPGRPLLIFIYLYFLRLGFLDGVPGYYYSLMRAAYELMIDVKFRNLKSTASLNQDEKP